MIGPEGYDYMKLTARQKYDYRDLDRGEAQLIRVGHALCVGAGLKGIHFRRYRVSHLGRRRVRNTPMRWLLDRSKQS